MRILAFVIIKIPRKIYYTILNIYENFCYRFLYSIPKLVEIDLAPRRYLLFGGGSFENLAHVYRSLFPDKSEKKIAITDLICEHIFDLLGSCPTKVSKHSSLDNHQSTMNYEPIDWHSDFKNGYRWRPNIFYRNIPYGHIEGVDIKVPWELSRFQHLNFLGQAYVLTSDKKYSREFINQVMDWIKNNPYCFGVNWKCSMEAAIRAVNWLVAMEYFNEKSLFSEDFLNKFYASIYEHGKFIRNHLEYASGWTTNHYLADITGLLFIAIYCPFFKESREWKKFALQEIHKEIDKQVYTDGCSFETSTSYHRLVLEIFFYSMLLGERAGIVFNDNYKEKVIKMFKFSLHCIKPNGLIPQIGDNDSGRFLIFSKRPVLEHKYLLTLAAIYFKDSSFKLRQLDFNEEAFWIFGETAKTIWDNLPLRKSLIESKSFPDAGWYVIRHNNDYCFISCGPNGGDGWHAHNDKLSFELVLNGRDIIVDPGTYVYTSYPDERNKFRSTEYHNTIKFNGYEQNEIPDNGVFNLPDKVKITHFELKEENNKIVFSGGIQYADIIHKRIITLDKESGNWHIEDMIYSPKPVNAKLLYHLSPHVKSIGDTIVTKDTEKKIASINVDGYPIENETYQYSREYGMTEKAECLVVNFFANKEIGQVNTYIRRS